MSDKINKEQEVRKVARRGITNETRGASQRKYHISMVDRNTKLFVGALMDVTVDYQDYKDTDASQSVFKGNKVPRLSFHFSSLDINPSQRAHVYKTFKPVESTVDTIPGGERAWLVEGSIMGYIKYLLDIYYLKGRELTDGEVEILSLPLDDVADDGSYNPVEVEEVLAAYTTLFSNVATLFNTALSGKPVFLSDKGAPITAWLKLITCYKSKNVWKHVDNGNLAFPQFTGEGIIEFKIDNKTPLLNLNSATESVSDRVDAKAPTTLPNMPGATMVMPGAPMGTLNNVGATPISDDLPF